MPPSATGPITGGSCFNASSRRQSGTPAYATAAASCSSLVGRGVSSCCPLASAIFRTAPLLCATADRMTPSLRSSGAGADAAEGLTMDAVSVAGAEGSEFSGSIGKARFASVAPDARFARSPGFDGRERDLSALGGGVRGSRTVGTRTKTETLCGYARSTEGAAPRSRYAKTRTMSAAKSAEEARTESDGPRRCKTAP